MSSTEHGGALPRTTGGQDHHWRNLIAIWLVLSAIADPIFWFFVGKYIPPGTGSLSTEAAGATFDAKVLGVTAVPVAIAMWVYFGYAIRVWRHPKNAPLTDGPPIREHRAIQWSWLGITSAIVVWVFIFGTYELVQPGGAGGGEGPSPIWTPTSKTVLPVQVIGQQWYWTYRYPTFGGFETPELVIPEGTPVAFHVTSLDVIHDFWAYQIGVKADANPGTDNVAYTTATRTGSFTVRCDELCGIWHGAMFSTGHVVSKAAFEAWAKATEKKEAALTATLPNFSYVYVPSANPVAAFAESGSRYPNISPTLPGNSANPHSGGKTPFSEEEIAPYQGQGER